MQGGLKWQVRQIWNNIDGIGTSKRESRLNTEHKGQNGQKVSEKVHSLRLKAEVINRALELGKFARTEFGIKDMQSISNSVIESYISSKIDKGLNYRSISTYISQLEKIQVGLSLMEKKRENHNDLFDRQGLKSCREYAKDTAEAPTHINRAYNNPEALKSYISLDNRISYELQKNYGLRVIEATKINKSQLNGNTLTIQGKGGYTRDINLSNDLATKLSRRLSQGNINIAYSTYSENLKSACNATNQVYHGTHGLRYNYAQKQYNNYISKGHTHQQALKEVSYNLGHHRTEITTHYLA